jgi:hypothetical protein
MREELGVVIARRSYFGAADQTKVEVELCAPVPSPHAPDEFMCSFRIRICDSEKSRTVFGIDELQVLQLALGQIHGELLRLNEKRGLQLRWVGDEQGDLGIRIGLP